MMSHPLGHGFETMMERDKTRFRVYYPSILADPNHNLTPTLTLNNINEWENALKTQKTKNNNFKKQIKQTRKTKLSLQLFLMANFDHVNGPIDTVKPIVTVILCIIVTCS